MKKNLLSLDAAHRWMEEHRTAGDRRVLVAGIRGIGTTLSAVVAAALRAGGWDARRLTVRPTGSALARGAVVSPDAIHGAAWGLVVDQRGFSPRLGSAL